MIGIVVVSHSKALATAAVGLAGEMVEETQQPAIAVAAGVDGARFGTDAAVVAEAITTVDSPDGVLVLLDLGSAVLSAEMALEFLDPAVAGRVVISSAPMVEGLVAAVVLASTGASIDAVADEARLGLLAKQEHLGDAPATPAARPTTEEAADSIEVEVSNHHGLHARPAARLVSLVRSFDAEVTLTHLGSERGPVKASSLSMVATLNAGRGDRLRVTAAGHDAAAALAAVRDLAASGFGDAPASPSARADSASPSTPAPAGVGSGLDVAIGPATVPAAAVDMSGYIAGDAAEEQARSVAAVSAGAEAIRGLRDAEQVGAVAGIFDAHLALLEDAELVEPVEAAIGAGTSAPDAWTAALDALAAEFDGLDDHYQRERAQDVRAVKRRLLRALAGEPVEAAPPSGILVVAELDAGTAATLDTGAVAGVATVRGGATGHGVIVARSRGIPIITDVGVAAEKVHDGALVAFDATSRSFVVDPDVEQQRQFRARIAEQARRRAEALAAASQPARTTDGVHIAVLANVGSLADAKAAAANGADGAGLVRTEVLFGDRATRPSSEEQLAAILEVAQELRGRPLTIRTWDVGGDKPLRFLRQQREANPFLGERGLRLFRSRPDVLAEQLRAICAAARQTPVQVMFPMVTTVEEVTWALAQVACAFDRAGDETARLRVGVMIEVPAAAMRTGLLAADLDFVSIGTNDLTQYVVAADRGNGAVAGLVDQLDPTLLGLVGRVCADVPDRVDVAVCGELASDPGAAVLLVGLGVRELSVAPPRVADVKARLRQVSLSDAQALATEALEATSADNVRDLLADLSKRTS
ncbi:MAG: phosphoenolpyruvate--protein phosphotransferase [Nocardioidaceae bacterium]|nr:phosphoenolpyruvate--protein phosphotransferase [Nocardioidaceae bacterium]